MLMHSKARRNRTCKSI